MKEKLIIRNFGPIKDVELDLGRFNILIGEQATGKSTVAKVLAVCNDFLSITRDDEYSFINGLTAWGLVECVKIDSYISYKCENYLLVVEHCSVSLTKYSTVYEFGEKEDEIIFSPQLSQMSRAFESLISELDKIKSRHNREQSRNGIFARSIPTTFLLNEVKNVMDIPFYLPTERGLQSMFSLGQTSVSNLENFLYGYFSDFDEIASSFKSETDIEPLGLVYQNRAGNGYARKQNEEQFFSLRISASGYQSTIPVVLVMMYYNESKKKKKTFIIEEPELNLFPKAQNKLMRYLVDKTLSYDNSILLTTHSPYILTSLNNMMYAYQTGQTNKEQVTSVIEKKYWLNPDDVSCYRMMKDGTAKNILDAELKQINTGEIDEISRVINEDWDKLANIEFGKNDEN